MLTRAEITGIIAAGNAYRRYAYYGYRLLVLCSDRTGSIEKGFLADGNPFRPLPHACLIEFLTTSAPAPSVIPHTFVPMRSLWNV